MPFSVNSVTASSVFGTSGPTQHGVRRGREFFHDGNAQHDAVPSQTRAKGNCSDVRRNSRRSLYEALARSGSSAGTNAIAGCSLRLKPLSMLIMPQAEPWRDSRLRSK
jgi:hypothetical protein